MSDIQYGYILQEYYDVHNNLQKILDLGEDAKHGIRTHLCLNINYNGNNILIPLRKNLGNAERRFGRIGFAVPSMSKPDAGLDYRYIMIIEDDKYIKFDIPKIPNSQVSIIERNYATIESQAIEYINSYIKVAKKGRVDKVARFRESSLINFDKELGV